MNGTTGTYHGETFSVQLFSCVLDLILRLACQLIIICTYSNFMHSEFVLGLAKQLRQSRNNIFMYVQILII